MNIVIVNCDKVISIKSIAFF